MRFHWTWFNQWYICQVKIFFRAFTINIPTMPIISIVIATSCHQLLLSFSFPFITQPTPASQSEQINIIIIENRPSAQTAINVIVICVVAFVIIVVIRPQKQTNTANCECSLIVLPRVTLHSHLVSLSINLDTSIIFSRQ